MFPPNVYLCMIVEDNRTVSDQLDGGHTNQFDDVTNQEG